MSALINFADLYPSGIVAQLQGNDDNPLAGSVSGKIGELGDTSPNAAYTFVFVILVLIAVRILWEMAE